MEYNYKEFLSSKDISCFGETFDMCTDFERVEIKTINKDKFKPSMTRLMRFINNEYFDDEKDDISLNRMFFLPSHIDNLIKSCFEGYDNNKKFPSFLLNYFNEYVLELIDEYGDIEFVDDVICSNLNKKVCYKERATVSTSFYRLENIEKSNNIDDDRGISDVEKKFVFKMVKDLKNEINALKDFAVCIGDVISVNFGLFEISYRDKTNDPITRHCNFWKYHENVYNKKFDDLSGSFELLYV